VKQGRKGRQPKVTTVGNWGESQEGPLGGSVDQASESLSKTEGFFHLFFHLPSQFSSNSSISIPTPRELAPWDILFTQPYDKYQGRERPAGLHEKGKDWNMLENQSSS
jgi:hypothetical protein